MRRSWHGSVRSTSSRATCDDRQVARLSSAAAASGKLSPNTDQVDSIKSGCALTTNVLGRACRRAERPKLTMSARIAGTQERPCFRSAIPLGRDPRLPDFRQSQRICRPAVGRLGMLTRRERSSILRQEVGARCAPALCGVIGMGQAAESGRSLTQDLRICLVAFAAPRQPRRAH